MRANIPDRDLLQRLLDAVVRELHPRRVFLFGSRARGSAQQGADFDLAVEPHAPVSDEQERYVRDVLNATAGLHSVDLILLDRVDPRFRTLVLTEGKLVYDEDHGGIRPRTV